MKIQNVKQLKNVLYQENYDRIAIWDDGTWAEVGTGYAGEQDGNNPVRYVCRAYNYNLTRKDVDSLVNNLSND